MLFSFLWLELRSMNQSAKRRSLCPRMAVGAVKREATPSHPKIPWRMDTVWDEVSSFGVSVTRTCVTQLLPAQRDHGASYMASSARERLNHRILRFGSQSPPMVRHFGPTTLTASPTSIAIKS